MASGFGPERYDNMAMGQTKLYWCICEGANCKSVGPKKGDVTTAAHAAMSKGWRTKTDKKMNRHGNYIRRAFNEVKLFCPSCTELNNAYRASAYQRQLEHMKQVRANKGLKGRPISRLQTIVNEVQTIVK